MTFLCTYTLLYTADMCDVTYIRVYNTYLHGRCFLSLLYNDIICLTSPQSMLLFVSSDSSSHAYATYQSSSLCTDQHHISRRNTACFVFACAVNTQHLHSFPSEGQCWECFTSSRLSWDIVGHGLPLEMPLSVTFSSCEWIINSWTRISRKFLCFILSPHDLCIRNAFRMIMSVRWKNSLLVHFHVLRAVP